MEIAKNKERIFGVLVVLVLIIMLVLSFMPPIIIHKTTNISKPGDASSAMSEDIIRQIEVYRNDLQSEYEKYEQNIDRKINALLGILGIAVTVWVALNIYYVVEKREIEILVKKNEELENKIEQSYKSNNALFHEILGNIKSLWETRPQSFEMGSKIRDIEYKIDLITNLLGATEEFNEKVNRRKELLEKVAKMKMDLDEKTPHIEQ